MTTYIRPTTVTAISDTFADHVARGSVNPGVDYETRVGTPLVSVAAGRVTDADDNPAGAGGKMVHVDHDDGTGADYLHLSGVSVARGQKVIQGQRLGYTGNTGDSTGPHLHMSFRPNHDHGYSNVGNQDFEAVLRAQGAAAAGGGAAPLPPEQEDDEMARFVRRKDGTLALATGATFTVLKNMDEARSIEAVGTAKLADMVQLSDDLIWNSLVNVNARAK